MNTRPNPTFRAEDANPSWWPIVLKVLARDWPEINDMAWSRAIGENAAKLVARREAEDDARLDPDTEYLRTVGKYPHV